MSSLFFVGMLFVFGAFIKYFSQKLNILYVVGYLVLGFLVGPNGFNIVPHTFIDDTQVIIDISLALISVLVGANLRYSILRDVMKQIVVISLFEAFATFSFVSIVFYFLFDYLDFVFDKEYRFIIAILFGGLAIATAPATILAIVHQLNIKSRFSSMLLGIVAMDNAFALISFSFITIFASKTIASGEITIGLFIDVLINVFYASLIGVVGAVLAVWIDKFFEKNNSFKTTSTLGMIFIVYGLSRYFLLEPLIASVVMGVVMANLSKDFYLVKKEFDYHLKDIIFLLFFTISAMHLNIYFLAEMPAVIALYVIFRILGKIVGAWVGAKVSRASEHAQKYLGIALFPQAGIAIGLALSLQDLKGFELIAPITINVIIATTLIHEFLGPLFTKYALTKK